MTKKPKVQITPRAAVQRINRALGPTLKSLKKARTQQSVLDCGLYYVIDHRKNYIVHHDVDLDALGKELGVIEPWEAVSDE